MSKHLSESIAAQINATRKARGWTQSDLAKKSGMAQNRISVLEDNDYENTSLTTLKRLASAFDVALVVRFVPFSEGLEWASNMTADKLAPRKFEEDHYRDISSATSSIGIPVVTEGTSSNTSIRVTGSTSSVVA